jgi:hypothetical protein
MKAAAANRKATQEAHDKILAAKKVFVPEENPAFQQKHSDGKDIWADMFTKYEEPPKSELPGSSVRLPQVCLEKMKVIGFEASQVVGELWGWQHKTLGWRVNLICTHDGSAGKAFDDIPDQGPESLTHLGFIRCGMDGPELTEADKTKLRSMAHGQPVIAVVVTYPAPQLVWLWDTNINCMNILRAMSYRVLPYEM